MAAPKEFKILVTTEFKSELVGKSVEEMLESQRSEIESAQSEGKKGSVVKTAAASLSQLSIEAFKFLGVLQLLIKAFNSILAFISSSQIDVAQYVRRGMTAQQAKKFLEEQEKIYNVNDFGVKEFVLKLTAAFDVTQKEAQKDIIMIANAFTQLANTASESLDAKYISSRLINMRKAFEMSTTDMIDMASYLQEFNKRTGASVEEGLSIFENIKREQLRDLKAQQIFKDIIQIAQSVGVSNVETVYNELSNFLMGDRGRPLLAAMSPEGTPNYTVAQFVKNEGGLLSAIQRLTETLDTSDEEMRKRIEMVSGTPDLLLALNKPEFRNLLEVLKTIPKGEELKIENVEDVAVKMLNYRHMGNLRTTMSQMLNKIMRRYQLDYDKEKEVEDMDFTDRNYKEYIKNSVSLRENTPEWYKDFKNAAKSFGDVVIGASFMKENIERQSIEQYLITLIEQQTKERMRNNNVADTASNTQINNTFYLNNNNDAQQANQIAETINKQVFNSTKLK